MPLNELDIAIQIKNGELTSPIKYSNMWLVNIRITGTGLAYRTGIEEHVWRDPSLYLNNEFLARINGLPVVRDHPDESFLNDDEFKERILGTVMLPYIRDDEVWAIVRIYAEEIIREILDGTVSTSPAVSFDEDAGNALIEGEEWNFLIEGKPALIDHIALVTKEKGSLGVWDKNQIPEGIDISNKKGIEMEKEALQSWLETLASTMTSKIDELNQQVEARFDSVGSTLKSFELRLDSAKKDEHVNEDKEKATETKKELAAVKERLDEKEENKKEDCDMRKDEKEEGEEKEKTKKEDCQSRKDEASNEKRFSWTAEDDDEETRKDNALTDARIRADSAFSSCGKSAPRPFDGESALNYRKRALAVMQKYSPEYKDVKINHINDVATLTMAEKTIYADAANTVKAQRQNTRGQLFEVIRTDAANRQIITYEGDPNAWLDAFKLVPRKVEKINTERRA